LRDSRALGIHRATRGQDFRISLYGFLDELGQTSRSSALRRRSRFRNLSKSPDGREREIQNEERYLPIHKQLSIPAKNYDRADVLRK
jgi:hypothetical protein